MCSMVKGASQTLWLACYGLRFSLRFVISALAATVPTKRGRWPRWGGPGTTRFSGLGDPMVGWLGVLSLACMYVWCCGHSYLIRYHTGVTTLSRLDVAREPSHRQVLQDSTRLCRPLELPRSMCCCVTLFDSPLFHLIVCLTLSD